MLFLSLPPSGQQAFLLENVPCNNASCHSAGRMFHIHWDQLDLGAIQNAVMATFFDIYEDVSNISRVDVTWGLPCSQCSLLLSPFPLDASHTHRRLTRPVNAQTWAVILLSDRHVLKCQRFVRTSALLKSSMPNAEEKWLNLTEHTRIFDFCNAEKWIMCKAFWRWRQ